MKTDLILTTYPRSGSNFLGAYLDQTSNIVFGKTHDEIIGDTPTATIIRRPEDSIASLLSMKFSNGDKDSNKITALEEISKSLKHNPGFLKRIEKSAESYIKFYKYIDTVSYVFTFEKVIREPVTVIDNLCGLLKKERFGRNPDTIQLAVDSPEGEFLASSRNLEYYNLFRKRVLEYDFSECNDLYLKALNKAI